jgi:hypothetical protein
VKPAHFCETCGFVLLLLAGCATVPDVPTEVRVPYPVPCLSAAEVPRATFPSDADLAKLPDGPLVYALAKDRLDRQAHIGRLEAVLEGCIGANP